MPDPSLLISPVDVTSTNYPSIPAGSNRLVLMEVDYSRGSAGLVTVPNSATIGTVAASYYAGDVPGTQVERSALTTWAIKEAQIASLSGLAITVSGGVNGTITRRLAYAVQDASQLAARTAIGRVDSGTGGLSIPLQRVANSFSFFAVRVGASEDVTLANPARDGRILNINYGYEADTAQTVSSTSQVKSYVQTGHIINFESVPAQAITDVNGGDPIRIGSTGNEATITGAPSAATGGTFGGEPITVTGWDSGAGVATFTMPGVVDGEAYPDIDSLQTLTITGSGWSASLPNVQLSPPVGSTVITVASPDNADPHKLGYHMVNTVGITPANGDKLYGIDSVITWLPNTGYEDAVITPPSLVTPVIYWDASTGLAYDLNVTIPVDGPIVIDGGLSSIGLTSIGLTSTGLTARGL